MIAKTIISLQVEKGSNTYTFNMPMGVPYGEAYDAAFSILEDILDLSKKAVESARREEPKNEDDAS